MKNLRLIVLILCFSIFNSYSQDFDFGKVSIEELKEKSHPIYESTNAAVLYRSEKINFRFDNNEGFVQEREIHERIKIYNKEGLNWASKKIYLYQGKGGKKESLIKLKAYTFNLTNGKIEKDKLTNEGKFEEVYNDFTVIKSFTMPNVKESSIIEYNYTIKSPYSTIDDVFFQSSIPINKLKVYLATPQYFQYNIVGNSKATFFPNVNKRIQNRRITITNDGSDIKFFGGKKNLSESEYEEDIIEIDENNIPPLDKEPYAGSLKKYISKLSFELSAYLDKNRVVKESFSSSWERVTELIYQRDNFGEQLKKTKFYLEDLNELIQGEIDDFSKVFFIQEFVKSKVKWNGNFGIETQKGVRKAYKEGVGNVSDINLLLVSMLRSQGLNANPVLVSTKDNGIPLFPTKKGFNYVICVVDIQGKKVLLDATEKYNMINVLPYRVLNWQGRLIKQDGSSTWINLEAAPKSVETTMLNILIDDSFLLSGKVRKSYTSYSAKDYRVRYNDLDLESKIKSHESGKSGIEISEYSCGNKDDITKPVTISYDFELSDGLDEIGGKLYFNPLFFFTFKENPFKLDKRHYPIDFVVPKQDKYVVNIQIPEGYEVESLPKNEAYTFNDEHASFKYVITNGGNLIRMNFSFVINNPLILPSDYEVFKDFYNKMIEKHGEQIVLTKV